MSARIRPTATPGCLGSGLKAALKEQGISLEKLAQLLFVSVNLSAAQKNDLKSARDVMQMLTFAAFLNGHLKII